VSQTPDDNPPPPPPEATSLTAPPPPTPPPPPPPPLSPLPSAPPEPAGYSSGYSPVAVPAGMYYDQGSGLVLPEGTTLAPIGRRIGAFFLSIVLVIVTLVIGYVIWGIIAWTKGTTPALQVLRMRCYRPDDRKVPGFWWMVLRNIVGRFVEGILSFITGIVSFILMCATKERRCLHDLIAGTVVLLDQDKVLDRF
jgi:uncharacterized RDD family membrane protein YckC